MRFNRDNFYFLLLLAFLTLCLSFHLGATLIGGFISYWLIISTDSILIRSKRFSSLPAKIRPYISLILVTAILTGIFWLLFKSIEVVVRENRFEKMLYSVILILEDSKSWLPKAVWQLIPRDALTLKRVLIDMINNNAQFLASYGKTIVNFLALIIIGMLVGAIFTFSRISKSEPTTDAGIIKRHITNFALNFKLIIFSQFWVAITNTLASILYLNILLPMFDIHVPYRNVAIIVTFCASLIPILGNLICNTLIAVLSLAVSLKVAILSLVYLIAIHKVEYLVTARVFGGKINCSIWEILVAIIFMESLFGLPGLIIAPVVYSFIKQHLENNGFFGLKSIPSPSASSSASTLIEPVNSNSSYTPTPSENSSPSDTPPSSPSS